MLRGLVEGALVMAFRPSTGRGFDGVVVPKGRELALLFQRVTQSLFPTPFYGPLRPKRLRCQSGHQHVRVIQRSRPNLLQPRQRFRFVLGAIDHEEAKSDGLNLVPILLCVNAAGRVGL